MAEQTRLVLRSDTAELPTANAALTSFCRQHGLNEEAVFDLTLALEEILTNIIRHGYKDMEPHEIDVVIRRQGDLLTLRVAHDGRPFDPSKAAPPDLDLPPEKRAIGGLGIQLVKSLTDKLEYRREDGRNVVTVRKKTAGRVSELANPFLSSDG